MLVLAITWRAKTVCHLTPLKPTRLLPHCLHIALKHFTKHSSSYAAKFTAPPYKIFKEFYSTSHYLCYILKALWTLRPVSLRSRVLLFRRSFRQFLGSRLDCHLSRVFVLWKGEMVFEFGTQFSLELKGQCIDQGDKQRSRLVVE